MHKNLMSDEMREFEQLIRKWLERDVKPHIPAWEEAGIIPREVYRQAGAQGLLCISQSDKFGGLELPYRYSGLLIEEIARAGASGLFFFLHSDIVAPYVDDFGSAEQKQKYLPGMASGDIIGAIAMTEPGAGSDLQGMSTTAVKKGDKWILNGSKTFISNGICSDMVIVAAKTDDGGPWDKRYARMSLFIVDADAPGFERGRNLHKMGLKSQDTAELFFQNCEVPESALLGKEGEGFIYLVQQLGRERLGIAQWCVGASKGALDMTLEYVKDRKAFGGTIADLQNTKFKLAECDTEISLAEALCDQCTVDYENGEDITVSASKAKYWSSEMLGRVVDECLQLHGGYGYMEEYDICRFYRDARVKRIYGGTTEIMKEIIGRNLIRPRR